MQHAVTISTAESKALVNVAELQEEGGPTDTITATIFACPHPVYLPLVSRWDRLADPVEAQKNSVVSHIGFDAAQSG